MNTTRTSQEARLVCEGDYKGTGVLKIQAPTTETMNGTLDIKMSDGTETFTMKGTLSGRWVGADCGDEDEGDVDQDEEPADDEEDPLRDAWTEPGGYPQTVELAELVTGHPGVDAWDRPGVEGNSLSEALGKLPRDQRQALVWHLIDGFSVAEIADFQQRSADEIEEDIRLAQQALQRELDAASFEKLEARLTSARHKTRGRP